MNLITRILLKVYNAIRTKILDKVYKKYIKAIPAISLYSAGRIILEHSSFLENMIYKDETWNYVKQLHKMLRNKSYGRKMHVSDNDCANNKIKLVNNEIHIKSFGIPEDWVYWYLNQELPDNYILNFKTIVNNTFTEFQIAFKHKSILERYRFRVVDNSYLSFEVVNHGYFFHSLATAPFKFEFNRKYDIKLVVKGNQYAFIVDDTTILAVEDNINSCRSNGIALIFWDESGNSKIDLTITNLKVMELALELAY